MKDLVCILVVSIESTLGEKTVLMRELKDINDSQDALEPVSLERKISSSSSSSSEPSSNSANDEEREAIVQNQFEEKKQNESVNDLGLHMSEYRSKELIYEERLYWYF